MGRHTRIQAKRGPKTSEKAKESAQTEQSAPGSLMDEADRLLQTALVEARRSLEAIQETRDAGDMSPALAREQAALNRSIAQVTSEIRQREKHSKERIRSFSESERHELVIQYIRELDYDGRQLFRKQLDEDDEEGGLLS